MVAKAPLHMKGYLNRPEEDAKIFAADGFVKTGDLGHYDEEGIVYFDGRHKELIKYKNCHLYPKELEDVIMKHPGVIEAGVFGKPDPAVQELVTAAVVKRPESKVTAEELLDFVNKQVDDAKKLRGGIHFVEKLPKNPVGKMQRRKLVDMIQ